MARGTCLGLVALVTWACTGGAGGVSLPTDRGENTGTGAEVLVVSDVSLGETEAIAGHQDEGESSDEPEPIVDNGEDSLDSGAPNDPGAPDKDPSPMPDHADVAEAGPDPGTEVSDGGLLEETSGEPPPLFDLATIRDPSAAQCDFHDHRTVWHGLQVVDVWRVSYWSLESVDGVLRPIRIRAFAARPAGSSILPGVVVAHGLGGYAEESHAVGHADLLGMFVIAYTGPGGGKANDPDTQSEGIPAGDATGSFYRLFDTVPDPRGSWMWGHAVAAMRAVTCLQTRGDVDPKRLGITGFSAGAMVSLIAAGVDDRIRVAVPVSGTGAFEVAVQSPNAWQHALLAGSGLTTASPQWLSFLDHLDPIRHIPNAQAALLMVNGSCDEFFPLTAHMATYQAIPSGLDRRTAIVANYDHGCYLMSAIEPAKTIEDRVNIRVTGNQRAWFQHHFGTNPTYSHFPKEPVVQVESAGSVTTVMALLDPGTSAYEVERVWFWASNDDAYHFLSVELKAQGGGLYGALVPVPLQDNTVYFVDVQYKTKSLLAPERFAVSSPPRIPSGFIPRIRHWGTCL